MKLESQDDQLMALAAMRYSLGRTSYIVPACHAWLYDVWGQLDPSTQATMVRDIIIELQYGRCGHPSDTEGWRRVADFGFQQLPAEQQQWVRDSVKYNQQPWPLKESDGECPNL